MVSGIYQITNLVNGKRYIGSAVNLEKRWHDHQHALAQGSHVNKPLLAAWNKYGKKSFFCRTLLICGRDNLLMYEQRCFDAFKPEYNITLTAGSRLGVRHTEISRAKMSATRTGRKLPKEHIEKVAAFHRGRKRSAATIAKMKISAKRRAPPSLECCRAGGLQFSKNCAEKRIANALVAT